MALTDLFERVMTVCGSPGSPVENHEGTAVTLANTGGSPGSPGSPEKMECAKKLWREADEAPEPLDREAFEERAGICEFDGGLTREDAETIAWFEDDRRRCTHCQNFLANGVCKVAVPGGQVSARRGYQPDQAILHRCSEYRPCPDDPDRRTGRERWPGP
jgi:hypothetical protein